MFIIFLLKERTCRKIIFVDVEKHTAHTQPSALIAKSNITIKMLRELLSHLKKKPAGADHLTISKKFQHSMTITKDITKD